MLAQPANTTCTSDKVFFTTLYRTFEGLFTSFFTKRIISPRIFEWYCDSVDFSGDSHINLLCGKGRISYPQHLLDWHEIV